MSATMKRYILEDHTPVPPFNQRAAELTIGTTTLNFYHESLMKSYFERKGYTLELAPTLNDRMQVFLIREPAIAYRDSLWFDEEFLDYFITEAEKTGRACRAAVPADDKCYQTYTFRLAHNVEASYTADETPIYTLDLWYLPRGFTPDITTIVIPSDAKEKGFYTVPDFMASNEGDLTHYLPARAVLFIETWFHVYVATIIFGVLTRASRLDEAIEKHNLLSLRLLWQAIIEQKQILSTSEVVQIGRNTTIHPSAIITGPAVIGDNCNIGPGVIIDNATIGDNVSIDTGCVVSLSTIGNNCFLPFRAATYLTALMDSTIVAQNSCLQMCVVGRNSFIGAGNTFTDFNLIGNVEYDERGRVVRTVPRPIGAVNKDLGIEDTGQTVLGGAVGHNCRLGSGLIVFPGRMVESDTIMFASPQRRVVSRSVTFEESDHHYVKGGADAHRRMYPRPGEELIDTLEESWDEW
jgi:UDP-N-acetylglucosamine diphosphorylase / glucose-1-phosphate thymidylyltransferase / UDP-N-acetylgalactosamine diphosphorylase / glucosamine-1-phosphate N-acetyltransferase / galactosamine-1-phosphate N-acetyltransferase